MSYDIYAAKIVEKDGLTYAEPVLPFEASEMWILCENPDEVSEAGGDPFVLNPAYVPGAAMNMSGGNWRQLVDPLCRRGDLSLQDFEQLDLMEMRKRIIEGMERGDDYRMLRLHQLLNVVEIGITRGADRLCVAGDEMASEKAMNLAMAHGFKGRVEGRFLDLDAEGTAYEVELPGGFVRPVLAHGLGWFETMTVNGTVATWQVSEMANVRIRVI